MRISDWSSDVCSSDLIAEDAADHAGLFTGVHIAIAEGCCFTHALSSSQVLQPPQRLLSPFLMPELPEVETTIAGLRPVLEGQVLTSVEPRRADLRWPIPLDLRQRLTGATVTGLSRRAKYGLIAMDRGDTRSEEHTSELQSLMRIPYAVFCLKKKNKRTIRSITAQQTS